MNPLLPGSVIKNKYRILEFIGRNEWVNRYRAKNNETGIDVFIKEISSLLLAPLDDRKPEINFFEFLKKLINIRHPNILSVLEYFKEINKYYVVTEYISGTTLHQITIHTMLKEDDVLKIAFQILNGMIFTGSYSDPHIFRCISAKNVMMTGENHVKIIDLAVSPFLFPVDKRNLIIREFGIPGYSPPEVYGNGKLDIKSDIYSFGVLLYFLYTHQLPPESIDLLLGNEKLTMPSTLRKNINPEIENIILKSISLDANKRFSSFVEIETALSLVTKKTWSSLHILDGSDGKKSGMQTDSETIPALEPYIFHGKFVVDRFRKHDVGVASQIGIDIGSHSIKITAIEKNREGLNITLAANIPTEPGVLEEGIIIEPERAAKSVRHWLEKHDFTLSLTPPKHGLLEKLAISTGLSKRNCVISVGGTNLIVRSIETDAQDPAEIRYRAQLSLSDCLPFKGEGSTIEIIKIKSEHKSNNYLIMAVSKENTERLREFGHFLGLNTSALCFEPVAIYKAIKIILGNDTITKTIGILNIGAEYSSLNLYGRDTIQHSRLIRFGGNGINRRFQEKLGIDSGRAESLKRECFILPKDGSSQFEADLSVSLFSVIEPVLKEFTRELMKTLKYYSSGNNEIVDLIVLTGGGALLKNIDKYLKNELGVSVVVGNLFRNVIWKKIVNEDLKDIEKEFILFAASVGLVS